MPIPDTQKEQTIFSSYFDVTLTSSSPFFFSSTAQTPSALRSVGGMLGYAGVSSLNVLSSAAKTVPAAGAAVLGKTLFSFLFLLENVFVSI